MQVPGVGEHTALLIHMLPQIARRYHIDRSSTGNVLRDTLDYADWAPPLLLRRAERDGLSTVHERQREDIGL